jgi:hypothetical protein
VNKKESAEFLESVLIAFPGVNQWLRNASPNAEATKTLWAKSLEQITVEEGMSVLSRWSSGKLPAPEGYAKESFHLHLIAVVKHDRSKIAQERTRAKTLQSHKGGSNRFYKSILGPFMAKVIAVQRQYIVGEIGFEERDRQIESLVLSTQTEVGES